MEQLQKSMTIWASFARAGTPICPDHNLSLEGQTSNQICDKILELPGETKLMV